MHHGVYPEQKQDSSASPQNDKRRRVQHDSVCHSERSEESKFYLYPLSLLSYLFALFSKEMAITLPLLIFFFDYLIGSRRYFYESYIAFLSGLYPCYYLLPSCQIPVVS